MLERGKEKRGSTATGGKIQVAVNSVGKQEEIAEEDEKEASKTPEFLNLR
jgi:hypothetical protein